MTVSCWTEVEAETAEAAQRIAANRDAAEHHIDGTFEVEECWHFDNDGTPEDLTVEDA